MAKEARSSRLSALRKRRSFPLERPLIGPFRIRPSSFVLSSILREYEGFENPEHDAGTAEIPCGSSVLNAFCDIAGNRYRRPSHLGGKAIEFVFRNPWGGSIDLQC